MPQRTPSKGQESPVQLPYCCPVSLLDAHSRFLMRVRCSRTRRMAAPRTAARLGSNRKSSNSGGGSRKRQPDQCGWLSRKRRYHQRGNQRWLGSWNRRRRQQRHGWHRTFNGWRRDGRVGRCRACGNGWRFGCDRGHDGLDHGHGSRWRNCGIGSQLRVAPRSGRAVPQVLRRVPAALR